MTWLVTRHKRSLNPLIATLKPHSNIPLYSNTVIGTLAADGWAVTLGTARRGMGGAAAYSGPSSLYHSPLISIQCTNVVLFDVAL